MPPPRDRQSKLLIALGSVAIFASLLFGIGGFATISSMMSGASSTIRSASLVVDDVSVATEAAALSVTSIREVIDDVESTARSSARALTAVERLLTEIGDQAAEDVAASIESAVDAMPGVVQTGRVIDRTLTALSFVGVDYDPEVPLDEALESLEQSLAPLPGEIREQVALLDEAARDISSISESSSDLAASLLEIRIDLLEAEDLVTDTATNVEEVSRRFETLADDFDTYRVWIPWMVVAAAVALASVGLGLLMIGLERTSGEGPSTQTSEH